MAPQRKRENREHNFYNVGIQGRKTGIVLADRGVYDEHGLEPISGIFSSPEKSPPKRGSTVTASESMELQESSIPDLTTSRQILRNSRTHLPPPRSRSPKKTTLGSSPRRQSSMAPRESSVNASSPPQAVSHPTARRLDFSQSESSAQDIPALSGSGARRGKRSDVYDIPEDGSPVRQTSAVPEDGFVPEDVSAHTDSILHDTIVEESFVAQVGDEMASAVAEESVVFEEPEPVPPPVKAPAARGRKRKSQVMDLDQEEETSVAEPRKRGRAPAQASQVQKKGKKNVPASGTQPRRSQRVSDITELENSALNASVDDSVDNSEQVEEAPIAPKRRGRPPRVRPEAEKENNPSAKVAKQTVTTGKQDAVFKKPPKPTAKPKGNIELKSTAETKKAGKAQQASSDQTGKLVDVHGNPLSKQDIDKMSVASAGSRYGRGRHLSVFREMDPEAVARVGRTGRHRVAPIDFWKNDRIAYDTDGSMTSIVKNQVQEPERKPHKSTATRGRKKPQIANEEDEIELDPWEEDEGTLIGNYRDFDPVLDVTSATIIEDTIAWAEKGIKPADVPDGSFKYSKLASVGSFFNWGLIELRPDQMKRTKNSRKMHMVFNVQSGTVEVKVHENEFTVHRRGIWQVPRGNTYSIRNIGSGTARVFFAQAMQTTVQDDE